MRLSVYAIRFTGLTGLCVGLVVQMMPACAAPIERAQLVEQLKQNCFSTHGDAAPSEKAKCDCFAHAFVESLTGAEIAVPKQSAAINAKLSAARHACHMGDF